MQGCVFLVPTLTIAIQVVGLIGPASGLGRVAGGHAAASAILCQEVRQSEGLPLFILLLSWMEDKHTVLALKKKVGFKVVANADVCQIDHDH